MNKRKILTVLILLMAGVIVLAYPSFSDYLNRRSGSYAISQAVEHLDEETASQTLQLAETYNTALRTQEAGPQYRETLDLGDGLMGSLEIPKIGVYLPIYHGTDSAVLAMGIGHLEGTALPVGGMGNHTVLTGHTGLPSAELLTDLTELTLGDVFYIHVLQSTLVYQVTDIQTVLPNEADILQANADKDLCTLVTCTPYGINSHRLLVTGERTERVEPVVRQPQPQQVTMPAGVMMALIAVFLLAGACVIVLARKR